MDTPTFWIDVGGTFTDCLSPTPDGLQRCKVLSTGKVPGAIQERPGPNAILDGFRRGDAEGLWEQYQITWLDDDGNDLATDRVKRSAGRQIEVENAVPVNAVGYVMSVGEEAPILAIRMLLRLPIAAPLPRVAVRLGTTRGTNALLTRAGARCGLVTTKGFADLLLIGNQDRPRLFDLNIVKPQPLVSRSHDVLEADERIDALGHVLRPLDESQILTRLRELRADGVDSLAVCLLHALRNPVHEMRLAGLAGEAGFTDVRLSHEVAAVNRFVPRAQTTVLDAYLDPVLRKYVRDLQTSLGDSELLLMTSGGNLAPAEQFTGKDSILSGPAGGVVGCANAAQAAGFREAIGFDMGGTSTDVSRYGGTFERQYESTKAGVQIATPSLAIETVAAGGGSICHFDGVRLTVGPDSAGSDPGPACYARGGPLTVTDINLFLGRIPDPQLTAELFPELSFPIPLDRTAVQRRLDQLIQSIACDTGRHYTRHELAAGFLQIANANMARAAKSISVDRGFDPANHVLVAFGGAAAQHACAVGDMLGVQRILLHPAAGLLSAYGIGHSQLGVHRSKPLHLTANKKGAAEVVEVLRELESQAVADLLTQHFNNQEIEATWQVDACYEGIDATITLVLQNEERNDAMGGNGDANKIVERYEAQHLQRYGFRQNRRVNIVGARVDVMTKAKAPDPSRQLASVAAAVGETAAIHDGVRESSVAILHRNDLEGGDCVSGPAIILDHGSTAVIDAPWRAEKLSGGDLLLSRSKSGAANHSSVRNSTLATTGAYAASSPGDAETADPALLELFNNQFSGIAEQMGITLRNTSSSVNVKERLDFSCAIFTPDGCLVVNAPHIPVHLGAMSQTVRCVIEDTPDLAPGDVIVTNDPYRGGSHLPDITVVLPVFQEVASSQFPQQAADLELRKSNDQHPLQPRLLFFTASRAHHAEIGGTTPGSMPPFSKHLSDEGVLIRNFKVLSQEVSRLEEMQALLTSGPLPSRRPQENLADIAAQIAACRQGARELLGLCEQHGLPMVHAYMRHMQAAAATKVSTALRRLGNRRTRRVDQLDNGAKIVVAMEISEGKAVIDFSGTDGVQPSNLNANPAIVSAAVMYCMRCLLDEDIPLNEGVLTPISIKLPTCLLNPPAHEDPQRCAAVVGGNVETSQRVVDVLLGALGVAAASQGTMNNLSFGDDTFGYYETICGGAGATATGHGADAVHTHMTNTRLTDPEVFESRHPVRLIEFSIRRNSHGKGRFHGGDGVTRRIEFLKPLTVSLLTQRRTTAPFGLAGGQAAAPGANSLKRNGHDAYEPLNGCCEFQAQPGDELRIDTPGGGGFGDDSPESSGSKSHG